MKAVKHPEIEQPGAPNPEQTAKMKSQCEKYMAEVQQRMYDTEQAILQKPDMPLAMLKQSYDEALKWSNVWNWLNQIHHNRFILPAMQAEALAAQQQKDQQSRIIQ